MLMDGEWSAEQSLETFESLDKNGDGWVERVEFTAFYAVSSPISLAPTILMADSRPLLHIIDDPHSIVPQDALKHYDHARFEQGMHLFFTAAKQACSPMRRV